MTPRAPESAPRSRSRAGRALHGVLTQCADIGIRRPKTTVAIAAVVLAVCAWSAWGLPVSTSRYNLVDSSHPSQQALLRFFDKFGYPDSMVMVFTGGDETTRRRAIDTVGAALEREPELSGRVLGRVGLDQVAELALLIQPDAVSKLREQLGEGKLIELVEGGLPAWVEAMTTQLERGMEEEATPDQSKAQAGFERLAKTLRAFDAELAGGDPMRELPRLDEQVGSPPTVTVDAKGYLVGHDGEASYHLMALFPQLPGTEGHQMKPLVDRIRAIRDRSDLGEVRAQLTGLPALGADELSSIKQGIIQTSGATTVGLLLLLYVAFRSFRYTVLALLPVALGTVLTLAVVRPLYGGLNLVTSSFISVLLGLGIDFGVYLLSRYGEQVRGGAEPDQAIRGALTSAGPGMIIGAVTTMAAFMMTTTTEFTAYSELGVITTAGLGLMLAVTFVVLPALIWLAGRGKGIRSPELRGVRRLPGFIRSTRWLAPAVAVVLVAGSAMLWGRIKFNARFFDFLPESTESAAALRLIERDESLSPIQAGAGADSIEQARALARQLRALPTVGSVQTATDALPELTRDRLRQLRESFVGARVPDFDKLRRRARSNGELVDRLGQLIDMLDEVAHSLRQAKLEVPSLREAQQAAKSLRDRVRALPDALTLAKAEMHLANILERAWTTARRVAERGEYRPGDLPQVFQARFMSKDGASLAVYALPRGDIWDRATANRFAADVTSIAPHACGLAISIGEHIRMIKEGFTRASILSAGLVLLVLLVGFRRLSHALLALLPLVVGVALMLGTMALIGLDFDVANIVTIPLVIGIGIDAGAHMMHRWRDSARRHGGVARLEEVARGTGAAVLLASLTTMMGFSALMLGDYGAMFTLGLAMTIGIGCCLLASLWLLPTVLVLAGKLR